MTLLVEYANQASFFNFRLWKIISLPLRLVLIENRNQLINPEESIESDIAHHLKNLSYGTDIQGMLSWSTKTWTLINNYSVIVAYFGCHGTNDQRGEFLHLLGKNIRTPRLAKISTIIQKNADLHENLKGWR